eukprot:800577-Alexandrium_andersonii.AAC.1
MGCPSVGRRDASRHGRREERLQLVDLRVVAGQVGGQGHAVDDSLLHEPLHAPHPRVTPLGHLL